MGEEDYPPGFRFYPTEEELVGFYLRKKLEGISTSRIDRVIPVIEIYNVEPWDLPQLAGERCRADTEQWFYFTPRQEKETKGGRPSRSTATGYWKATGSPGFVYSSDKIIGVKKTMVFYRGRAPNGRKTKWKMHEYRAVETMPDQSTSALVPIKLMDEFSLCRVYVVSGTFRAFDRRPMESTSTLSSQAHRGDRDDRDDASGQNTSVVEKSNSSDTSHSGGDQHSSLPDFCGSSSTNWEIQQSLDQQPLWEWEQLNWL